MTKDHTIHIYMFVQKQVYLWVNLFLRLFYSAKDVIATYVYRSAFSSEIGMPRLGYASAAALFFGAVVIVVGVILNGVKVHLDKKN